MRTRLPCLTVLFAVQLGGCAHLTPPKGLASVPQNLMPDAAESLRLVVPATGVQVYECRVKKDQPDSYEWAFVAPEADLYDQQGRRIGKHYGGPHWGSNDGSTIVGSVKARADAPAASAIPWLLLNAKSVGSPGLFDRVTSIQRVNTVGGVAPEGGCSAAAVGAAKRVPYTADYYFFSGQRLTQRTNEQAAQTPDQGLSHLRTGGQFFRTKGNAVDER